MKKQFNAEEAYKNIRKHQIMLAKIGFIIICIIPLILARNSLEARSSKIIGILITLILCTIYVILLLSKEVKEILTTVKTNTLRTIGVIGLVVIISIFGTLFGGSIPQTLKITGGMDTYTIAILVITAIIVPIFFIQKNYIQKHYIPILLGVNSIIIVLTIITYNYISEISSSYRAVGGVIGASIAFQLIIDRLIFEFIKSKKNKIK